MEFLFVCIPDEMQSCGHCVHWNTQEAARRFGLPTSVELAPCAAEAVEPDAGPGAVVLLGPESHCRCHGQSFEPTLECLAQLYGPQAACVQDYGEFYPHVLRA